MLVGRIEKQANMQAASGFNDEIVTARPRHAVRMILKLEDRRVLVVSVIHVFILQGMSADSDGCW